MNFLDILILNIVAVCLLSGFFEGLFKEIVSIIGIAAAFYPASKYYPLFAKPFSDLISNTPAINIIGFFVLFGVLKIGIGLFGIILHRTVWDITFARLIDHFLGTLVGFAKGVLLAAVIIVTLTAFLKKDSPLLRESVLSPHVAVISDKMALFAGSTMKKRFFTKRHALENSWEIQG
jgi:membrane protein required for colicin V production